MTKLLFSIVLTMTLAGCSASGLDSARELEPIPGSITYHGQPRTKLTKAPVGSSVPHVFRDERGRRVDETYVLMPDRSLKLVRRRVCTVFCDD